MNTGIIRRIDDLGRVVIPKEIRRGFKIYEGDPIEIGVDGDNIILTKYRPNERAWPKAKSIVDASCNCNFVIADRWGEIKCAKGLNKAVQTIEKIGDGFGPVQAVLDDFGEVTAQIAFDTNVHPMVAKTTVKVLRAFLAD